MNWIAGYRDWAAEPSKNPAISWEIGPPPVPESPCFHAIYGLLS
jgi:hypothetical protein